MEEGGRTPTASPRPPISPRLAAAMAAVQTWMDPPDNILVRVSAFLPCRADRVHMACVHPHWRSAVTGLRRPPPPVLPPLPKLPPQLPWLIFPCTEPPTFYSVLGRSYHRLYGLPNDVPSSRCCGSGDDGWLVLAFHHAHALYNLNSGQRIPLPPGFRSPSDNAEIPLVVHAATFSASPSHGPYVVAAIALVDGRFTAAFWSQGRDSWFSTGDPFALEPQDVIHFEGAFLFLMPNEELIIYRTEHASNGDVTVDRLELDMQERADYGADVGVVHGVGMLKRYLVGSRGRLLMVVRYAFDVLGTKMIQVYRLRLSHPLIYGYWLGTWEHMHELDGRMLFLGQGGSRSFEVAGYDGFRESEIYFIGEKFLAVPAVDDADAGSEDEDDDDAGSEDDDEDAGWLYADEDAGWLDDDDPGWVDDDDPGSVDNDAADDDVVSENDSDGGSEDDDDAGSVENDKPGAGRYFMAMEKSEPWPPGLRPRSDAPTLWWFH